MDTREQLFTQAMGMKFLLDNAAAMVQNPVEQWSWKNVEDARQELTTIGNKLKQYTQQIDDYLTENTPTWASQWDLANELFAPYNDPDNKYNTSDIEIPVLAKEFEEKGLCKELAEVLATSIKYPQLG